MSQLTALMLSNDAVRAAIIGDPYSSKPKVLHFHMVPLPQGAVVDGEIADDAKDKVVTLLKTLIKNHRYPTDNVALAYASRRLVLREANFPDMGLDELRQTLPFQAEGLIPLPVDQSILDFVPISKENTSQGTMLHGLIVATLRSGLESVADVVEHAGFILSTIDAAPFCVARVFASSSVNRVQAIVNVGASNTDVLVMENGSPRYVRTVTAGDNDVIDAVASALSIPHDNAVQIKRRIGLQNVVGDERLEKAEEVIRETVAQLIVGVRNTVNYYDNAHPDNPIQTILLTGIGATLGGFPAVLASSTNKVVRLGDPFANFSLSKDVVDHNIAAHAADYAAVLGLALGKRP
ncbi:MAG: type IV pilus assembly protein PilM [Bifidobacteriaceae bacterium]|nr:type IV pilus assembly protein PilM [Bifidobacteriaceae bacterium]